MNGKGILAVLGLVAVGALGIGYERAKDRERKARAARAKRQYHARARGWGR